MKTRRISPLQLGILLIVCSVLLIGILIGCNTEKKQINPPVVGPAGGSGPAGGGETQKLTLLANPSETIPVTSGTGGTATITALVENNIGQPMPNGTAVYWSTTFGTLNPTTTTSTDGSASVTLTLPADYNGCSKVKALSGDVQAEIKICAAVVTPTPTSIPAPVPTPTPGPTATPAISVSLGSSTLGDMCTNLSPTTPANLTAIVYRNSISVIDIPVVFSVVGYSPALDATTNCSLSQTTPPLGTLTTTFSCISCSGGPVSRATIRVTASGAQAEVTIDIDQ